MALIVALVVVLRVQGIFQWPFVLFVVALVVVAEADAVGGALTDRRPAPALR